MPEQATIERVYLDGKMLVIETTFGRTSVGLREHADEPAVASRTDKP